MIKPYDWQKPAVEKSVNILRAGSLAINVSDTGTGKTICSLAAMKELRRRCLVIAPKVGLTHWRRTAEAMRCKDLLYDVVNPERLLYSNPYYDRNPTPRWHLPSDLNIIWDEVHRGCSGKDSQTTKALALTKAYNIPVMAMSATVADDPLKLRALGYLAGLHNFNRSEFLRWCLAHGCKKLRNKPDLYFPKNAANRGKLRELHEEIKDMLVRISIDDVPDFPEGVLAANLYDLDKETTDQFVKEHQDYLQRIKRPRRNPDVERLRMRQQTELLKVPLLAELVEEILEEDKSAVVFVNFTESRLALVQKLEEAKHKVSQVYGQQKDRDEHIDRFQANKTHIMVCMSQAGGLSLNLHDIHQTRRRESLITPSYSASEFVQCLGRIHRTGGTNVIQRIVLIANTIEQKIYESIQGKLGNLKALLTDEDLEM